LIIYLTSGSTLNQEDLSIPLKALTMEILRHTTNAPISKNLRHTPNRSKNRNHPIRINLISGQAP